MVTEVCGGHGIRSVMVLVSSTLDSNENGGTSSPHMPTWCTEYTPVIVTRTPLLVNLLAASRPIFVTGILTWTDRADKQYQYRNRFQGIHCKSIIWILRQKNLANVRYCTSKSLPQWHQDWSRLIWTLCWPSLPLSDPMSGFALPQLPKNLARPYALLQLRSQQWTLPFYVRTGLMHCTVPILYILNAKLHLEQKTCYEHHHLHAGWHVTTATISDMHQRWIKCYVKLCAYQIESAIPKLRKSLHPAYNICLL